MRIFGKGKCKFIANFSATMVTSLPSLSLCLYLSLSPKVPHAQYRKRFRASYNKKNAHGQRRAISVRGTSFHSETGLGLWLKRKPFPHLRTEARSKRNRRVPIETRRGPIEATARQTSVRQSHSRICNPKHGANETRRVPIETRREASVFG